MKGKGKRRPPLDRHSWKPVTFRATSPTSKFRKRGLIFDQCVTELEDGCMHFEATALYNDVPKPQRIAWILYGGGTIGQRQVVSTCSKPDCVNPAHLALSP